MAQTAVDIARPQTSDVVECHRIHSITFSGGFYDGTTIELADGLNCLIGNRGTGKTTALEFVRYALDEFPDDRALRRRVESLVAQNLGGGRIELAIETKDGIRYTVSRTANDPPLVCTADGEPTSISLASGSVFRADIYSQNQVESIASDPASQLALVDGFIAGDIAEIDGLIDDVLGDLHANAGTLIECERDLARVAEQVGELPAVEEALRKFKAVAGESAEAINTAHASKALRECETRAFDGMLQTLRTYHDDLSGCAGRIDTLLNDHFDDALLAGPNGPAIREALDVVHASGVVIDQLLGDATAQVKAAGNTVKHAGEQLVNTHARQETAFRQLIEKHKDAEQQSADRAKLERKHNELTVLRKTQDALGDKISAERDRRAELLQRLSELRDERFALRRDRANAITEQLKPEIRVRVEQFGNRDAYCGLLEAAFEGRSFNRKVVARKLADAIAPSELAEIVTARREQGLIDRAGINSNQAAVVLDVFSDRQRQFDLETVELLDQPSIDLRDGDVYKDSLSLSTGQKCTAVLPILMLDSVNPLLIDQPEDNLDNRFMVDAIVRRIRDVKAGRQLVFVTHNPNIPVLGDAERVYVLASDGTRARVDQCGSVNACKDAIVTLLEGGREAFMQRKDRYGY